MRLSNILLITICFPLTWTIYVPEYTKNNIKANQKNYVSEKHVLQRNMKKSNYNLLKISDNNGDNDDGQQKLFITRQAKTNAHQFSHIPRKEKSYDIDDAVVLTARHRTNNVYENLEAQPSGLTEQQQHKLNDNVALNEFVEEDVQLPTRHHSRQRRQLSDFFMVPNTRWCGRGNTANGTYNHLGGATVADKCCRTHDHCKVYIPAMSNRFDLFNYRPYTLSHCNCDRRFRTCLKMANDEDANTIGTLFFNVGKTQCFILTKEVICQQRANDGTCLKEHIKQKAYLRDNRKY